MTILSLLTALLNKAGAKVGDLKAELEHIKQVAPDTAPIVDPLLAALEMPVDAAGVATAVIPELGQIALFKFDGREHPSDGF